MSRSQIHHENCKPPKDNPPGNLVSLYYHTQNQFVRLNNFMICNSCHCIVKIQMITYDVIEKK